MISDGKQRLIADDSADPAYSQLVKWLEAKGGQSINVSGLPDPLKSWLAWRLSTDLHRRICFLVPDELKARAVASDLKALMDDPVFIFRPREWNLTDVEAVSHESEYQRMAILTRMLSNQFGAIIIPASATLQKLPPVSLLSRQMIRLSVGQELNVAALTHQLASVGYEPVRLTDCAGQFAHRGDIVDFVPSVADDEPAEGIRISFFDREIDAIKRFDLESQRSIEMLTEIVIPPVREILTVAIHPDQLADQILNEGQSAVLHARQKGADRNLTEHLTRVMQHDAERVREQIRFPALDRWLSYIYPDASSILDYAADLNALVIVDEPARFRHRSDAGQAEFHERIRMMLEKGQSFSSTRSIMFQSIDIGRKLDQIHPSIAMCQILSSGNGFPGARSVTIQSRPSDSYRGREQQLITDVDEWIRSGGRAILFAGSEPREARLTQRFAEQGVEPDIFQQSLPRGFTWPGARLLVIGSQDLFGTEKRHRRRHSEKGLKIDFFSDLVPGERVVHDDHGIGRYDGLVNIANQGIRRDYLKITYAGNDTLYIPMESLDQIQKYVGADAHEPKLSKLGGQEWGRMKERARTSIRQLATDLIKLYAERAAIKGLSFLSDTIWQQEFEEQFPYEETQDQIKSILEIKADMESDRIMDRLLCGDVGYGKTEVAFRALFKCVTSGYQGIVLAPTTVLAQQHYDNLVQRLEGFPVTVGLLSRFVSRSAQNATIQGLKKGSVDIVVGTHRILSSDIVLKKPGLLIVDEEQRFGVDHKEKLKAEWPSVDVLSLSATPIPRTLHMAMSGIRDISVLEEPPLDRRPVQTYVMEYDEEIVTEAILREVSRHGQVFYLFNDTRKILEKASEIEQKLPGIRIACAHGKMGERQLEDVISSFIHQTYDVLVCTTIIESGIDMPNVNTIIVENADRLGLAQLYQLRGRVGRSNRQAYAYVTYRKDRILTEIAEKRLTAIRDFTELGAGFKIALRDLEVRGAGNLLGAEQHGHLESIGYDLYCRMLDEAVRELQGQPQEQRISAVVDLKIDAYIPPSYVPDEGQRMDLYRRIAGLSSRADYQDILDECLDRYGELPESVMMLVDVSYIRYAAGRNGFVRIEQQHQHILLKYDTSVKPDMKTLSLVINQDQYKGLLLFNAGTQPYVLFRHAAKEKSEITRKLRHLFFAMDPESVNSDTAAS